MVVIYASDKPFIVTWIFTAISDFHFIFYASCCALLALCCSVAKSLKHEFTLLEATQCSPTFLMKLALFPVFPFSLQYQAITHLPLTPKPTFLVPFHIILVNLLESATLSDYLGSPVPKLQYFSPAYQAIEASFSYYNFATLSDYVCSKTFSPQLANGVLVLSIFPLNSVSKSWKFVILSWMYQAISTPVSTDLVNLWTALFSL